MKLDKVTRYMVRCTVIYLIKKFNIPHQEPSLVQTLTNLAATLSIEGYVNAVATLEANLALSLEGTVETQTTLTAVSELLLDQVSGASAAYSLRRLSINYTGPLIRVRRSSDNQEQDFQTLDTLLSFVGSGNGFVSVWYDQSGNGNHAVQTTAASQPQIVSNGLLILNKNKPAVSFNGSTQQMTFTRIIGNTGLSVFGCAKFTSITGSSYPYQAVVLVSDELGGFSKDFSLGMRASKLSLYTETTATSHELLSSSTSSINSTYVISGIVNSTTKVLQLNSEIVTGGTSINDNNVNYLGGGNLFQIPLMQGFVHETIIFNSTQISNSAFIHNNLNTYYNIYWDGTQQGLLDVVTNSTIGFSLRALNSTYTGPIIRVRRSSDNAEQNIFARYDGSLDTPSLLAFTGTGNAFVTTWYDQSGNNRHATQTTASAQPLIVVNGVLHTDLSRPSITFTGTQSLSIASSTAFFNHIHNGTASTITVVARPGNVVDPNAIYPILSNADLTSTNVGFTLAYEDRAAVPVNNAVRLLIYRGVSSNPTTDYFPANTYNPNEVNTLTLHIDADAVDRIKVYKNLDAPVVGNTFTNPPSTNNASLNLRIGNAATSFFVGSMSEIVLTNTTSDQTTLSTNTYNYYNLNQIWTGQVTSLLDTYPGAAAAYSLRALNSSYKGPLVRVRRASDNTEMDIPATSTGVLDEERLSVFCAGTDGLVSVWYDQSLGNWHAVQQSNNANQPSITTLGLVNKLNGKPTLRFDGTDRLASVTLGNYSGVITSFAVFNITGTNSGQYVYDQGNIRYILYLDSNALRTYMQTDLVGPVRTLNQQYLSYALYNLGASQFKLNNLSYTGSTGTSFQVASAISIGTPFTQPGFFLTGNIQEIITYRSNQSANEVNIRANINTFHNVY